MDLTAIRVLDALALRAGRSASGPDEVVDPVRRAEQDLAVAPFSTWVAAGADLIAAAGCDVGAQSAIETFPHPRLPHERRRHVPTGQEADREQEEVKK